MNKTDSSLHLLMASDSKNFWNIMVDNISRTVYPRDCELVASGIHVYVRSLLDVVEVAMYYKVIRSEHDL